MIRENIITEITHSKSILLNELMTYGSTAAKIKNKYSCPLCSSSDALSVKENKNKFNYHCFSCQSHGDAINLVELKEGINTGEAIKLIAERNGITIPSKVYSIEEKRKYAQIKKAKKIKEDNLKMLEKASKDASSIEEKYSIEMKKDQLQNEPLKILEYPSLDFKGEPLKTWDNLQALLEYYNIYIVFNEITKNIEVKGMESDDLDDCIMDIHMLCQNNNLKLTIDFIGKAINRIGSMNSFNPVTDYLQECYWSWDGKEGRIKSLCNTLEVEEDFSINLRDKLITKWLLNTVKVAFNDGKFNTEGILVLQGKQGLRKTTWIGKITPKELEEYTKTGLNLDPNDKDKIYQAIKYWLAELGELDATMKAEQSKLKAFFTEKVDEFRRPYARNTSKYPRRTSFFGTVNKKEFLKDDTGDRRYWIIPCVKILIEEVEKIDITQLWGEVMHLEERGAIHYLTEEDLEELNNSNGEFRSKGKTQILVENLFCWKIHKSMWTFKTGEEIAYKLNLQNTSGLNEIFKQMGIEQERKRITDGDKTVRKRGYTLPPYTSDVQENINF